jgi:8-oxo-dGTP diphosphatase
VSVYLVRHAKAGSARNWTGDDRLRPLTAAGELQAEALAHRLSSLAAATLISSPYLRCVQTLEPLARRLGCDVANDERLAEGQAYDSVLKLIESLPDGAVLCSHGDVIPDTIAAFERRGCAVASPPEWRKGSVWVLHRGDDGHVTTADAWAPPDVTS